MVRMFIVVVVLMVGSGCGLVPGSGRLFSDYQKTSHYMVSGASKMRVRMDWGSPDEIVQTEGGETWIYHDRQDGRTFKFLFNARGAVVSADIE